MLLDKDYYDSAHAKQREIFMSRNESYESAVKEACDVFGYVSVAVFVFIKVKRLVFLLKKETIDFKAVEDTLLDCANYCSLFLVELYRRGDAK